MSEELKLERTRGQWAISDPKVMAMQSPAAIMYALQDAKRDIEALHRALEKARADERDAALAECERLRGLLCEIRHEFDSSEASAFEVEMRSRIDAALSARP